MKDWPPEPQGTVIGRLESIGTAPRPLRGAWRELVREILQIHLDRVEHEGATGGGFPVSDAATMLAEDPSPQDEELINRTLRRFPRVWDLWLTRISLGELSEDELQMAADVYANADAPLWSRFAAAVAASEAHPAARDLIRRLVNETLERYGHRDAEQIIKEGLSWGKPVPPPEEKREARYDFTGRAALIPMLRHAHEPLAKELVSRCLDAKNQYIRGGARKIAEQRFPGLLHRENDGS